MSMEKRLVIELKPDKGKEFNTQCVRLALKRLLRDHHMRCVSVQWKDIPKDSK